MSGFPHLLSFSQGLREGPQLFPTATEATGLPGLPGETEKAGSTDLPMRSHAQ